MSQVAWLTPFKRAWLILGTKKCGGTDRIDVAADVHMEVSRDMCTGMTTS
jgi:hypothetical protein